MKNTLITLTVVAALSIFSAGARSQDTSRVPELNRETYQMDFSIHPGVDEQSAQAPPSIQKASAPPTSYSRWGFQSMTQVPASRFWPAKATDTTLGASSDGTNPASPGSASFYPGTKIFAPSLKPSPPSDATIPLKDDKAIVTFGKPVVSRSSLPPLRSLPARKGQEFGNPVILSPPPTAQPHRSSLSYDKKPFEPSSVNAFADSIGKSNSLVARKKPPAKQHKHHSQSSFNTPAESLLNSQQKN